MFKKLKRWLMTDENREKFDLEEAQKVREKEREKESKNSRESDNDKKKPRKDTTKAPKNPPPKEQKKIVVKPVRKAPLSPEEETLRSLNERNRQQTAEQNPATPPVDNVTVSPIDEHDDLFSDFETKETLTTTPESPSSSNTPPDFFTSSEPPLDTEEDTTQKGSISDLVSFAATIDTSHKTDTSTDDAFVSQRRKELEDERKRSLLKSKEEEKERYAEILINLPPRNDISIVIADALAQGVPEWYLAEEGYFEETEETITVGYSFQQDLTTNINTSVITATTDLLENIDDLELEGAEEVDKDLIRQVAAETVKETLAEHAKEVERELTTLELHKEMPMTVDIDDTLTTIDSFTNPDTPTETQTLDVPSNDLYDATPQFTAKKDTTTATTPIKKAIIFDFSDTSDDFSADTTLRDKIDLHAATEDIATYNRSTPIESTPTIEFTVDETPTSSTDAEHVDVEPENLPEEPPKEAPVQDDAISLRIAKLRAQLTAFKDVQETIETPNVSTTETVQDVEIPTEDVAIVDTESEPAGVSVSLTKPLAFPETDTPILDEQATNPTVSENLEDVTEVEGPEMPTQPANDVLVTASTPPTETTTATPALNSETTRKMLAEKIRMQLRKKTETVVRSAVESTTNENIGKIGTITREILNIFSDTEIFVKETVQDTTGAAQTSYRRYKLLNTKTTNLSVGEILEDWIQLEFAKAPQAVIAGETYDLTAEDEMRLETREVWILTTNQEVIDNARTNLSDTRYIVQVPSTERDFLLAIRNTSNLLIFTQQLPDGIKQSIAQYLKFLSTEKKRSRIVTISESVVKAGIIESVLEELTVEHLDTYYEAHPKALYNKNSKDLIDVYREISFDISKTAGKTIELDENAGFTDIPSGFEELKIPVDSILVDYSTDSNDDSNVPTTVDLSLQDAIQVDDNDSLY